MSANDVHWESDIQDLSHAAVTASEFRSKRLRVRLPARAPIKLP